MSSYLGVKTEGSNSLVYTPENKGSIQVLKENEWADNDLYRIITFIAGTALAALSLGFIILGVAIASFAFMGAFSAVQALGSVIFITIPCFVIGAPLSAKGACYFYEQAFYKQSTDQSDRSKKIVKKNSSQLVKA